MFVYDPIEWLQGRWADLTGLPDRLLTIAARAHAVLSDSSRPREERERAGRVWAGALADRAEALKLLTNHVRERSDMSGMGAIPVLAIIGMTAAAVVGAFAALLVKAGQYEKELDLIGAGAATPEQLEALRTAGGPAATLRELGGLAKVALAGAAGWLAWRTWGG